MAKWLYSDDGFACRYNQPDNIAVLPGEVAFNQPATADQLANAFSNYNKRAQNTAILQQITILEATITTRRMREAALGTDAGWMKALDTQIVTLRSQLEK